MGPACLLRDDWWGWGARMPLCVHMACMFVGVPVDADVVIGCYCTSQETQQACCPHTAAQRVCALWMYGSFPSLLSRGEKKLVKECMGNT